MPKTCFPIKKKSLMHTPLHSVPVLHRRQQLKHYILKAVQHRGKPFGPADSLPVLRNNSSNHRLKKGSTSTYGLLAATDICSRAGRLKIEDKTTPPFDRNRSATIGHSARKAIRSVSHRLLDCNYCRCKCCRLAAAPYIEDY